MATVITIANNKGGIAKTTSSIHLGADLAQKGFSTLLIDFDPQRNLSSGYNIPENYPYNILSLLNGDSGFRITSKAENLFVLAGSEKLDSQVYDILLLKERLDQLKKMARSNKKSFFDYIIIDCPPQPMVKKFLDIKGKLIHIPKLNEIAVAASNYALIPVNAEKYSIDGLSKFIKQTILIKEEFNPSMEIAGVFFSKVMVNETGFKKNYEKLKAEIPEEYFCKSFIRKDKNIEIAKNLGKTIYEVSPNSRAAFDYSNLTNEVLQLIKSKQLVN